MKIDELFADNGFIDIAKCESIPAIGGAMQRTPQTKEWHKEGNVWQHTLNVVKMMNIILNLLEYEGINIDRQNKEILLASAMLHDLGKPKATYYSPEENDVHCSNHGQIGAETFEIMFEEDKDDPRFNAIYQLIKEHMLLHHILQNHNTEFRPRSLRKIKESNVDFFMYFLLNVCDSLGSVNNSNDIKRLSTIQDIAVAEGIMNKVF